MNRQQEQRDLDEVLDEYVASEPGPGHVTLREWIRRYPQYERELTEFTVSWSVMRWAPPAQGSTDVDEDVLVLRGMSVVQNLLHEQEARQASTAGAATFTSLLAESKARGLAQPQVASALRLSPALVRKLDRRLIRANSIPGELIGRIARLVQREAAVVALYFRSTPVLPRAASYLSEQAPMVGEPEDFFEAVQRDLSLSDEDRQYWLALARPEPPDEASGS